jgi:hypothetical protein
MMFGSSAQWTAGFDMWSTYRFVPQEWKGTRARLFTVCAGEIGQGFRSPLDTSATCMLVRPHFSVCVKSVSWELRRVTSTNPIQQLAEAGEGDPGCLQESLLGLLPAASLHFESSTMISPPWLMSADLPKGPTPWRESEDWRGGVHLEAEGITIPAHSPFAVMIAIFDSWRPLYTVDVRVTLRLA